MDFPEDCVDPSGSELFFVLLVLLGSVEGCLPAADSFVAVGWWS